MTIWKEEFGENERRAERETANTKIQKWASAKGRAFVKRQSAFSKESPKLRGSRLVTALNPRPTVQIAIRLPEADIDQARLITEGKPRRR